jgi:hypothetical protein
VTRRNPDDIHESLLEERAVAYAKAQGWMAVSLDYSPGAPDRLFLRPPSPQIPFVARVLFVEFKQIRGRVTPEQAVEHRRLRESGFRVAVVRRESEFRALLEAS